MLASTKNLPMNEMPLMKETEGIVLFYPNVPKESINLVTNVLQSRWIGQGPRVEEFEQMFEARFAPNGKALSVGSGTDALHLSYILADLKPGDEIAVPVFTCTATNIPFLYMGCVIRFVDVDPNTLNININHLKEVVNEKTKAIVCVHYGGLPCDMDEIQAIADQYGIPVIEDAAHALGATYKGRSIGEISDFTMFSFQAIKHITTGDGGMVTMKNKELAKKGARVRWFGIDRENKQRGIWENDITEVGYKYQMTDIAAAMGIAGLNTFDEVLAHRKKLLVAYEQGLEGVSGISFIGKGYTDREHAAWLCTAMVEDRVGLMNKLRHQKIESAQVHYRNDRYSIFGGRRDDLPNMDAIEDKYLVLPLHPKLGITDVNYICNVIKQGW